MTLLDFNYTNNPDNLPVSIAFTDTDTSMILDTGYGALLDTSNMIGTIEGYSGGLLTKREVVLIGARTADTLSGITRAYESCVQDDTATPKVLSQNALDFTGLDTYLSIRWTTKGITDLQDEIKDIVSTQIPAKLSITDYIAGTKLFANSTTGTDAYAITLSDVTSLTDGMRVYFEVDVANSAAATLNVSSTGVYDLRIFGGDALETGYISAGQVIEATWDAGNSYWEVISVIDNSATVRASKLSRDVTLGETLNAGDGQGSFFFGDEDINTLNTINTTGGADLVLGDNVAREKQGLIFTPSVEANLDVLITTKLKFKKIGAPLDDIEFNLYASNKTTLIASYSQQLLNGELLTTAYVEHEIDGQSALVTPGTEYFLEVSRSGALDATNYYAIENVASNQESGYGYSTYDGTTWTDSANDLVFNVQYGKAITEGKAYGSDTRYAATNKTNGIITVSGVLDDAVNAVTGGEFSQTSVDIGEEYFLNTIDTSYTLSNYAQTIDATLYLDSDTTPTLIKTISITANKFYGDITALITTDLPGRPTYVEVFVNAVSYGIQSSSNGDTRTWSIDEYLENGDTITFYLWGSGTHTDAWEVRDITTNVRDWVLSTDPVWGKYTTDRPTTTVPVLVGKGTESDGISLMINEQNFAEIYNLQTGIDLTNNTVYQALTDGIVLATTTVNSTSTIIGYADATDATTQIAYNRTVTSSSYASISFPVLKGQYYKVNAPTAGVDTAKFYPLST